MAAGYVIVGWNRFKRAYDGVLLAGLAAFLAAHAGAGILLAPAGQHPSEVQLLIRASGAAAFSLLTIILCIGPLARLTPRVLPVLYNRRHLGVACFAAALVHGGLVVLWYHGFSEVNAFVSLLISNPRYGSFGGFPFESLGALALLILFVMAATSHDFWNHVLGPRLWKWIHMSVYAAYGLLVGHVMLGAVQGEKGLAQAALAGGSALLVAGLHIVAGQLERRRDRAVDGPPEGEGWLDAGPAEAIPDGRAVILVPPMGERIAVFRDGAKVYAVANACRHQGGPLGEGRILDGCIVCPWHGFQYRPEDGCSPPPFTEKIPTYRTRITGGWVFVEPSPQPPGTPIAPSIAGEAG
ncbi:MAG: Rieske 2Fe-2S domain-containing protein [Hyphomonas sp.]|uniref:Rieske 2Fe-2S domain-containing protein n=1 Tax=Hyphomonas sp. TaxID=87 RepID=UPI0017E8E3F5|nr:Rieske 2Fe-2S domain-containing protein [Hyphomonas sp.]MBA3067296.1 Rieske 2Fe-2S domain-containing protein [Hyphomonas sp.]MBU3919006.1 ferric reductase-like transmembrane domain-containing protein [Alphaproteobacteria bacterium]MBU4062984.1 ferric reductase-like transmembrane domain-containing protein [Alphaproteobacteria bacterium]MBU4163565.1 ferric reductase-like transmembrane domain-containing protein [Alphaproteobacteria bacterium]